MLKLGWKFRSWAGSDLGSAFRKEDSIAVIVRSLLGSFVIQRFGVGTLAVSLVALSGFHLVGQDGWL